MKKYRKDKFDIVFYDRESETWHKRDPVDGDIYWIWEHKWKNLSYKRYHIEYKFISGLWIEQGK